MKKGFTLAELLIVIVIVGVLTLVALPKYRTAVERARALEAVENVCMLDEYLTVHQALDSSFSLDLNTMDDKIKSKYFTLSNTSGGYVTATRNDPSWDYYITSGGCYGTDCARLDLGSINCTTSYE